jgi:hypothetical protein
MKRISIGIVLAVAAARIAQATPAGSERRLHVASAEASSYLVNDWNKFQENYLPLYVGDDDPKTAWTLKTEGIGEWLRVHVTPMTGASKVRLKVRNGYQKSDKLWAANSRARGLTIVLLPTKASVDVELTDTSGWQEVAVPQATGALDAIELRVRSVYPGKKYDDLVISDVQVFVTATTPDNPAFEKQRLQKIADWKKERTEAAKLFATQLGQALPVAAQYVSQSPGDAPPDETANCDNLPCSMAALLGQARKAAPKQKAMGFALGQELARAGFAGMTPVKVATRDKRPLPRVDGVCTPRLGECVEDPCYEQLPLPAQLGYLNAETLVTTEQSGLPTFSQVLALEPPQCRRRQATTFAWVARDAARADGTPGPVRAVLLAPCGLVDGREGAYPATSPQLLVYGADGWLETSATPAYAVSYAWERDAAGPKLARADVTTAYEAAPRHFEAASAVVAGK